MKAVIFTDLDGTLLDHDSYSHQEAEPALQELRTQNIPVIFCTSKTRAEVEAVRSELGNGHPFIVENGGAIFIPSGYFPFSTSVSTAIGPYEVIEFGVPYLNVVDTLRRASAAVSCPIRGFYDLSAPELASICQLSLEAAERAKQREYDEPFEVLTESSTMISSLFEWIEEQGLTWTRGARFYHARGRHNKGLAARVLMDLFRRWLPGIATVGIGDGPNDISLLDLVDVPIVIPTHRDRCLEQGPPWGAGVNVTQYAGPRGWNQAVLQFLESLGTSVGTSGLSGA